jgi:hypothetical protein
MSKIVIVIPLELFQYVADALTRFETGILPSKSQKIYRLSQLARY